MHKIKLEKFEGPLDLLLKLIESQELDITQVSLAQLTDQYLEYLNQSSDLDPEELADFLVVATRLLVIKSRLLLPTLEIDEEEGPDLEEQLKIYREYLEASKVIEKIVLKKKFGFPREKPFSLGEVVFSPPKNITIQKLQEIFKNILDDLKPLVNLPQKSLKRAISIQEKIKKIKDLIFNQSSFNFNVLLEGVEDRAEIIVSFLALLELVKQRIVVVVQEEKFQEILIKRN